MNAKHILCPIDFSTHGEGAITYATSLAKEYDAELHLLHIYERHTAIDAGFATAPVPESDLEAERKKLEAIAPTAKDVRFRRKFIEGLPSDDIVKYAVEENIDLIVMGTHGRTGLGRLLMGSVAEAVVRRAPCPVLTIKQPAKELQES